MTLTFADRPASTPTPARTQVVALVLTGTNEAGLGAALDALSSQTLAPARVVVVDRTGESAPAGTDLLELAHHRLGGHGIDVDIVHTGPVAIRAAVHEVVAGLDDTEGWLVWVLAAGVTPASDALDRLLQAHRRSPSVGLVGPKLLDAADPSLVRSVGISATRSGRLVADPVEGAADQGQYDRRTDVLAVPVIGALMDASLVMDLGGWERSFGDVGADLDFGWRAQQRGRRVLVHTPAKIRVIDGLGLATGSTGERRRAGRRVALARARWFMVPLLALWVAVSSLLSFLGLLLAKRPRAAWAALGDLASLNPFSVVAARWRTRSRARVRSADLQGLFVSSAEVRRRFADQVHQALVPTQISDEDAPPELRRSTAVRVLTNPGLLLAALATAGYAAAGRTLGIDFLTGLQGGPVGGELLGGRMTASAMWHAWVDPWRGAGLGAASESLGGPHLGLLALATRLVEHVPGLGGALSPGGTVIGLLLLLGPGLAALSAYAAGRVLTSARWPRAGAALVWAVAGPASAIYAQGRLGAVVPHVLVPAVCAGWVLLSRRDGTATAAWATALVSGVLAAFAPITLVLLAPVAILVILLGPTAGARLRAFVPLLVAPLLLGPWLLTLVRDPRLLLAGPGVTDWSSSTVPAWQLALLQPDAVTGPADRGSLAVTALVALLAAVGMARSSRFRSLPTALVVLAVTTLAAVLSAPRVTLAVAGVGGARVAVHPWVGVPMLLLLAVLLAGALLAVTPTVATEAPAVRRWRRFGGAVLGLPALAGAVLLVVSGLGTALSAWSDPRPAVAVEHSTGEASARTLFVTAGRDGAGYRLMGREITDVARSLPVDRSDDRALASTVTGLLDGADASGAALAAYAISVVAVNEDADPAVTRAVDATDGLTRLLARDGWNYWRVATARGGGDSPVAPPRLSLQAGEAETAVPVHGIHGATSTAVDVPAGATLVVAEPVGWAAVARVEVDGTAVTSAPGDRPSYAVPAGTHQLDVRFVDPHRQWRWGQYALWLAALFLAVPFGNRASRVRS